MLVAKPAFRRRQACHHARGGQKKWHAFFCQAKSWRKLLNYYHPVKAPPLAKQSCNLCGIDNTSLLIHSCLILCSNACKIRCFAAGGNLERVCAKKKVCHI